MLTPEHERGPVGATNADESQNQIFRERNDHSQTQAQAQVGGAVGSVDSVRSHVEMIHSLADGLSGRVVVVGFGEEPEADGSSGRALRPKTYHNPVGNVDGTLSHIAAMIDEPHRNIYMPLAIFHPDLQPGKKGGEADIVAVLGFVADFDDDDRAHLWFERCPVPPSMVLETSSGRFQAFFLFSRPLTATEAKPLAIRLEKHTGADSCSKDLSHVWRIAGTLNWPNASKIKAGRSPEPQAVGVVVPFDGRLIDPDDLDAAMVTTKAAEVVTFVAGVSDGADDFDVASFLHGLPAGLRNKIKTKPGVNTDRSADIFGVVQALLKKNLSNAQIAKVIEAHPDGIGNKYVGRSDLLIEVGRIRTKPPTSPDLVVGANGSPLSNLANTRILLKRKDWVGVLRYNDFANRVEIHRKGPVDLSIADHIDGALVWNDACDTLTAEWMQHQGVGVKSSTVAEAVEVTARENSYHPVREYLDGLHWDGRPRLDKWMIDYLGSKDSQYTKAVSSAWMIGAVARIYSPACKMDYAIIIEGQQGIGKSSALRVLAGDYFSDDFGDIKNKDTLVTLHSGVWIVEMGELDTMSRSEVNDFKKFMSKQVDTFRPPYGRRSRNFRRSFVFAGTTNEEEYLKDATGDRRYWPVTCTRVDVEALQVARDQLWAEAADRFRNGEKWYLEGEVVKLAQDEQRRRYVSDPWEDRVVAYASERSTVTTAEVLKGPLMLFEAKDWGSRANTMRVAKILRANGWELDTSVRPRVYNRPANLNQPQSGGLAEER